MRSRRPLAACAVLLCMVGCESNKSAPRDPDLQPKGIISDAHRPINEALVRGYQLEQADNAIIRQHTLYPYHFVAHSAVLNDLGNREVHVLATHYRNYPGPVNLNRSDESDGLYEGRIKTVLDTMAKYGVESGSITVKEGLPGGEGLSSNQVVLVVERMRKADNSGGGSGSQSNSNSNNSSGSNERQGAKTIETSGGY